MARQDRPMISVGAGAPRWLHAGWEFPENLAATLPVVVRHPYRDRRRTEDRWREEGTP